MKLCFGFAVLFMLFPIQASHSQSGPTFNLKLKESHLILPDSQKVILTEKNSLLAGTLSFTIPGFALGQFYNEQKNKAFIHIGITMGLFIFAITYADMTNYHFNLVDGVSSKGSAPMTITAIAFIGNWLWSIVDAVMSANNINKQVRLQKYRSVIMDRVKFGITSDRNKNLNLKFVLDL